MFKALLKIPRSMKYYHEIREYLCDLPFLWGIFLFIFQSHIPLYSIKIK